MQIDRTEIGRMYYNQFRYFDQLVSSSSDFDQIFSSFYGIQMLSHKTTNEPACKEFLYKIENKIHVRFL
jgi:hypothetical protein